MLAGLMVDSVDTSAPTNCALVPLRLAGCARAHVAAGSTPTLQVVQTTDGVRRLRLGNPVALREPPSARMADGADG